MEALKNYVEGKVVAITGAGSQKGFGKHTVDILSAMGAKLVILDIVEEGVNKTIETVRGNGGEIVGMVGDASNEDDVKAMVQLAVDTYGKLDVFVANAGTMPLGRFDMADKALNSWNLAVEVNLRGSLYAITACYPQMQKQGYGQMVFISSIFSKKAYSSTGVYTATKAGVAALADALRQEAKGLIKVSVVNPTGVMGTNLGKTVVGSDGGSFGANITEFAERMKMIQEGTVPAAAKEVDSIQRWELDPVEVAENIVYTINQPWGVNISEITIRASNELFV